LHDQAVDSGCGNRRQWNRLKVIDDCASPDD
jgi:hypothetical protein